MRHRVEELLAAHGAVPDSFLPLPEEVATADVPELAAERPGMTIGPYKLLQLIGEGGFGSVFMAEQERPVHRRVALKIIKWGMDTRQVIARFEAERQALALMDHPNVARVYAAGATDTGRPYFVMELVKGVAITEYCDKHNLSIEKRLELFTQVCQAVQHAHQKGLIHRDIKPSNVIVATQDDRPIAKVIDFGIAKATQARLTEKTLFTEFHQWIGTPEYMSPEQAEGSLDIDTRSDVYSLGVLLYELLAGAPPFDPRELRSKAYMEIQRIIREVDPPRPSMKLSSSADVATLAAHRGGVAPRRLHTLVSGELDWIVMCCLEKDRARRYASASALATDLQHYLVDEPVAAGPPSRRYRARKFVRRNRGAVVASAVVLAVLIAGITGTGIGLVGQARQRGEAENQRRIADDQRTVAQNQAAEARKQAAIAEAVQEFLSGMLTAADPDRMLGDKVTVLQAITAAIQQLDAGSLKDQPLVEASVRETIGDTLRALGRFDGVETNYRRALELRRRFDPSGHVEIANTLNRLGMLLQGLNRLVEAEPLFREALEIMRAIVPPEEYGVATGLINLGELMLVAHRLDEAEPLFREALAILRRILPPDDAAIGIVINNLASVLLEQEHYAQAEVMFSEVVDLYRRVLPPRHPRLGNALGNLAGALQREGKLAEAERCAGESLDILRAVLPAGHARIAQALNNLAVLARDQGHSAQAEAWLAEALELRRKALPAGHPQITESLINLAQVLLDQGKFALAEARCREAIENSREIGDQGRAMLGLSLNCLALILRGQGRAVEAERTLRELLLLDQRDRPAEDPMIGKDLGNLAMALLDQGRLTEAESPMRQAVLILRKAPPAEALYLATTLNMLGLALQRQYRFAEAEPLFREALEIRRARRPDTHPDIADSLAMLAGLRQAQSQPAEASKLFSQALDIARKGGLPPGHVLMPRILSGLAATLRATGEWAQAESPAREAIQIYTDTIGADHGPTGAARCTLGRILTDARRYAEAETELLVAERILAHAQSTPATAHDECVRALAALYSDWDKLEPGHGHDVPARHWQALVTTTQPASAPAESAPATRPTPN